MEMETVDEAADEADEAEELEGDHSKKKHRSQCAFPLLLLNQLSHLNVQVHHQEWSLEVIRLLSNLFSKSAEDCYISMY